MTKKDSTPFLTCNIFLPLKMKKKDKAALFVLEVC